MFGVLVVVMVVTSNTLCNGLVVPVIRRREKCVPPDVDIVVA